MQLCDFHISHIGMRHVSLCVCMYIIRCSEIGSTWYYRRRDKVRKEKFHFGKSERAYVVDWFELISSFSGYTHTSYIFMQCALTMDCIFEKNIPGEPYTYKINFQLMHHTLESFMLTPQSTNYVAFIRKYSEKIIVKKNYLEQIISGFLSNCNGLFEKFLPQYLFFNVNTQEILSKRYQASFVHRPNR